MKQPFLSKSSLPKRQIAGRAAWGIRIQSTRSKGSKERREVWFDLKTDLPVLLTEFRHINGLWIRVDERTVQRALAASSYLRWLTGASRAP